MTATEQNNAAPPMRLGLARRGYSGVIQHLDTKEVDSSLSALELESRLIELGFVEGAREIGRASCRERVYCVV